MIAKEFRLRELVKFGLKVIIVVPCYNVQREIRDVVCGMPDFVSRVILVDDASRDFTAKIIDDLASNIPFVEAIHLKKNLGVGGATLAGFHRAVEIGAHVIIKMDGDGQMDAGYLSDLIDPLARGEADYTKGNRLTSVSDLREMPWVRLVGNSGLSLLARLSTGYWNVLDPTNGYIAIRSDVFALLPKKFIDARYFFEISMLLSLGIVGAVVRDVPMPSKYSGESSNLNVAETLVSFPFKIFTGFARRIWYRKVLYALTMEAILFTVGSALFFGGALFGVYEFLFLGLVLKQIATPGTVMFAALPILAGIQLLMNALMLDIQSVPTRSLSQRITPMFLKKEKQLESICS